MADNFFRVSMPYWQLRDNEGRPVANGRLFTYSAETRESKPVYKDPAGQNPWEPYIPLDGQGYVPTDAYWADDELYYIEVRNAQGVVINGLTLDNFPFSGSGGGGGGSTTLIDAENKIINGQFRFNIKKEFDPIPSDEVTEVAYLWEFYKNNDSATDKIQLNKFALGSNNPPYTPIFNLRYLCEGAGSNEQEKWLQQKFTDVRSFEQEEITISFEASTDVDRQLELTWVQNFGDGAGATAEVVTPIGSPLNLSGSYNKYHRTFTVPSVGGSTIDGDDFTAIRINYPKDSVCDISITNVQINFGSTPQEYEYQTYEEEESEVNSSRIPTPTDDDRGKTLIVNEQLRLIFDSLFPIGSLVQGFWKENPNDFLFEWADGRTVRYTQDDNKYKKFFDTTEPFVGGRGFNGFTTEKENNRISISYTGNQGVNTVSDGTSATGFTFSNLMTNTTGSGYFAYSCNLFPGEDKSSGLYVRDAENPDTSRETPQIINGGLMESFVTLIDSRIHPSLINLFPKPASQLNGGEYVQIFGDQATYLTVWVSVDGNGSDPGTGTENTHKVDLKSTDSKETVSLKLLNGFGGYQVDEIETVAASNLSGGEYFEINSQTENYYVWYEVNGQGEDPKVAGKSGIKVVLNGSESANDVADKTSERIKKEFFQIPDAKVLFLRGWDDINETYGTRREGPGFPVFPNYEGDQVREHSHPHAHTYSQYFVQEPGIGVDGTDAVPGYRNETTSEDATENNDVNNNGTQPAGRGGKETRPSSLSVKRLIKIN